jgi:beta-glucosidase-like glycosyl hydrolase
VEVPSEDPFHTGEFGRYFVKGMAGGEGPWDPSKGKYLKVAAALKHLTAYSREDNRMSANYNISSYDLTDTYLSAFANAISHNPGVQNGLLPSILLMNEQDDRPRTA